MYPVVPHSRVASYEGRYKYVLEGDGTEYLYDLGLSPYEGVDVLADNVELARTLRSRLVESTAIRIEDTQKIGTDPEILEKLRSLGYVR